MTTTKTKALVVFVIFLAFLGIAFENVVVFLGSTGALPSSVSNYPYVLIVVPLVISLLLFVVLIGGAIRHAETLR